MRVLRPALLAVLIAGGSFATASAQEDDRGSGARAVFVQSNDTTANQVLTYQRGSNGALMPGASYPTGGNGGRLTGAVVDPLASQGSLEFNAEHDLLIGVNAGSDTVYTFKVDGARLSDRQVLSSGGVSRSALLRTTTSSMGSTRAAAAASMAIGSATTRRCGRFPTRRGPSGSRPIHRRPNS